MAIVLVAPIEVRRAVRKALTFPRRTTEEILSVTREDPWLRALLLKRHAMRPWGHVLLSLTCGHVVVQPSRTAAPVLWRPQLCEMCTRRENEMAARYRLADIKTHRRQPVPQEAFVMAKIKKTKTRANKGHGHTYTFLKTPKVEPGKDTIMGCVYYATRKLKTASVEAIMDGAMKLGLNKITHQDPRQQTQVMLRRLASDNIVRKEKPVKKTAGLTLKKKAVSGAAEASV